MTKMKLRSRQKGKNKHPPSPTLQSETSETESPKLSMKSRTWLNRQNTRYHNKIEDISEILDNLEKNTSKDYDILKEELRKLREDIESIKESSLPQHDSPVSCEVNSGELSKLQGKLESLEQEVRSLKHELKHQRGKGGERVTSNQHGERDSGAGGMGNYSYREPTSIYSSNKNKQLSDVSKTAHIPNFGNWININPKNWLTSDAYNPQIAGALRGWYFDYQFKYIEKIQRLPPVKTTHGFWRFPANVIFKSLGYRDKSLEGMRRTAKRDGIPALIVHFSLNGYPKLAANVKSLSNILKNFKKEGRIEYYSLNNFMATPTNEKIAPMYEFRITNGKSQTTFKDSYTNQLFFNGLQTQKNNGDDANYNALKDAILGHIEDEEQEIEQAYGFETNYCKECAEILDVRCEEYYPTRSDITVDDLLLKPGSKNVQKCNPEQTTKRSPQPPQNGPENENIDSVETSDSVTCIQTPQTPFSVELDRNLNPNTYNEPNTPSPCLDFGVSDTWNTSAAVNFEYSTPELDCTLNPNTCNERNTPSPYLDFGISSDFWKPPPAVNFEFSTPTSHFLHTPDLRPIIMPSLTSHLSPEEISPRLWQPENHTLSYTILE